MAAACGMDVESFFLEQLAAGFDAAEQQNGQQQDGATSAGSVGSWQRGTPLRRPLSLTLLFCCLQNDRQSSVRPFRKSPGSGRHSRQH